MQSPYPVINFPLGLTKLEPCLITSYEYQTPFSDILGTSSAVECHLHPPIAGFYIASDFSNIFYSFSNHFQCSVYGYVHLKAIKIVKKKKKKKKVCGFQVYLYIMHSNDHSSVLYWFCTGKSCDCRVYIVFAKVFEHSSYCTVSYDSICRSQKPWSDLIRLPRCKGWSGLLLSVYAPKANFVLL